MPIAILIAVFVSLGTSFAAQGTVPGDFLYPIKTEVNENVRAAFAVGANAEAKLQADLLEERLEEAQTLHAKGRLNSETEVVVAQKIKNQMTATSDAMQKSDTAVAGTVNARVQVAFESFIASVGTDSAIVASINASFGESTLSEGTIAIGEYTADLRLRVDTLRAVIEKYQADIEADVKAELSAKLDTAALLVVESSAKAEADARTALNSAAILAGEVESKLSTLGQAQVDVNTGIITDIDFSVDPMKIDVGADGSGSVSGSIDPQRPQQIEPSTGEDPNAQLNSRVDTDVEGTLETTSGLGL